MNRHLKFFWLLALAALLVACSGGPEKKDEALTDSGPIPRYLELIPAKTPYVFGALDPVPEPVALEQYSYADRQLTALLADVDPNAELNYMDPEERFVMEVARELNGKLDEKGLAELGLSTSPRLVVYGIGPLPVFRMEIADADKFMAMIDRAESKSGLTMQRKSLEGVNYRSVVIEDVELSMAVIGNEVVFTGALLDAAPIVLPYALGVKKPDASLADDNALERLAETYGLKRHGVGFVNIVEAVAMITGGGDALNAAVFAVLDDSPEPLAPACQREANEYAASMPMVAMGLETFSTESVKVKIAAMFTNDIPARLKATKRPIPGWTSHPMTKRDGGPIKIGLGFRVGDVLNIARDEMRETRDRAFECPELQALPQSAGEVLAMSQLVPPVVGDLEGARVEFAGVDTNEGGQNFNVWAVLRSPDPQTLFNTIKSFAPPEIQQLQLEPNGEPVALDVPQGAGPAPAPVDAIKLFMTNQALGMTTKDSLLATAQAIASAEASGSTPMVAFSVDVAALMSNVMMGMGSSEEDGSNAIRVTIDPTDDAMITTIDVPMSMFDRNSP